MESEDIKCVDKEQIKEITQLILDTMAKAKENYTNISDIEITWVKQVVNNSSATGRHAIVAPEISITFCQQRY